MNQDLSSELPPSEHQLLGNPFPEHEPLASISCNPTIEQLYDFMGGNLSDLRMSQFTTHLQGCSGCDDVFHFHQGLLSMLSSSCREDMPPELRQRLIESITRLF